MLAALLLAVLPACNRTDDWLTEGVDLLSFSMDTVAFDTVFTTMGSTVQVLKVYNRHEKPLMIDAVSMQQGAASRFRLNVDGDTSRVARNVQLAARDSLFIFVRANINPNNSSEPFLVEDAILFDYNDHRQPLVTTAFGRNAVYHLPTHSLQVGDLVMPYSVLNVSDWDHTKPHIVFGYGVVDEDSVLTLQPGEELYFANGASLWVYDGGSLQVQGSASAPVLFTSLRHDGHYHTLPDQWLYLWLSGGSKDNRIDWAVIENANCGLRVDTCVNHNPTLTISNTIVRHHALAGIVGQGAVIEGDNVLVYHCGVATLLLQAGGTYRFTSSTFANYWNLGGNNRRTTPGVILTNYHSNAGIIYPRPLSVKLHNCIVWGNHYENGVREELQLNQDLGAAMEVEYDHCLLATQLIDSAAHPGKALLVNRDPLFSNYAEDDYRLSAESPALGAGSTALLKQAHDLTGTLRPSPPAIGAYEQADTTTVGAQYKIM